LRRSLDLDSEQPAIHKLLGELQAEGGPGRP
jgi:hypothetical protein